MCLRICRLRTNSMANGIIKYNQRQNTIEVFILGQTLNQWPGLQSFGMVHSVRELSDGRIKEERRYYISSLPYKPELFAKAVRDHWGIENRLHWCLDVSFGEDLNRSRTKNAAANLNTLRKIAMNILRREPSNKSLIQKQRKAARSPQCLRTLLQLDA